MIDIVHHFHKRKIILLSLSYRVIGMGLAFIISIIIARGFGAKGAGLYYIFLSIVAGLSLIANFGNERTIVRISSMFLAEKSFSKVKGVWVQFILLSSFLSILMILSILFYKEFLLQMFFTSYMQSCVVEYICLAVLLFSIMGVNNGLFRGQKRPVLASFLENILLPLSTIFGLLVLTKDIQVNDGLQVIISRVFAISVVFVLGLALAWKTQNKYKAIFTEYSILLKESWPIFGVGLIAFLSQWSATFIIALYLDEKNVGIYNTAWRLVLLVAMINFVFNNINSPYFSADYETKNMINLERRVRKTAAASSIAGALFLLPLSIFANPVLSLFGSEFTGGIIVLWVLALGQFISMTCGSVGYLLMMTGFGNIQRNINLVILILQLFFLPYMVDNYGILGAAIVASCALAVSNLLAMFAARSVLNIRVLPNYGGLL